MTTNLQVSGASGYTWDGTIEGKLPPTVDAITLTPGGTPAGGICRSGPPVAPISGMGDDTLVNFNVAAFQWGRETYTRLGVDSNGYVIVGGGTAEDNQSVPRLSPTRRGRTTW